MREAIANLQQPRASAHMGTLQRADPQKQKNLGAALPRAASFMTRLLVTAQPGGVRTPKLVLGFVAEPEREMTRLVTETRVYCPGRTSFFMLPPYWLVIR